MPQLCHGEEIKVELQRQKKGVMQLWQIVNLLILANINL
jgi:hypothetical protein